MQAVFLHQMSPGHKTLTQPDNKGFFEDDTFKVRTWVTSLLMVFLDQYHSNRLTEGSPG